MSSIQISTTSQMHCLLLWSPHNVQRWMAWMAFTPQEGKTFLFLLPRYSPFSIHSKTTRYATNLHWLKYKANIIINSFVHMHPCNHCNIITNKTHYLLYWQRVIGSLWPWMSPPVYGKLNTMCKTRWQVCDGTLSATLTTRTPPLLMKSLSLTEMEEASAAAARLQASEFLIWVFWFK